MATGVENGMPAWLLTAAYSLHMLATVIWIGGISFQALFLVPLAIPISDAQSLRDLNDKLRQRFLPLAWLSLAILGGSGLMQMTANPNYTGFLTFSNRWSIAILLKHLAIAGMLALLAYQTWVLYPHWTRSRLRSRRTTGEFEEIETNLLRRERTFTRIHLLLSVLILLLTAIARTA